MQENNQPTERREDSYPNAYNYAYTAPDPSANTSGVSIVWHYIGLLRRRFWIILPFILIGLTAGMLKAAKTSKTYSARAKIIVSRSSPNIMSFDTSRSFRGYDPAFAKTQPEIIKSRVVMEIALENSAIQKLFVVHKSDKAYKKKSSLASDIKNTLMAALGGDPMPSPEPWEMLSGRINAAPEKDSSVITINVSSGIPQHTALIANAAAEAFREYHLRLKLQVLNEAAGTLIKEKDKQEKLFIAAEEALQKFYEDSEGFSGEGTQPASSKLTSINNQRTQVQLDLMKCNIEMDIMTQVSSTNEILSDSASRRIFTIPAVQASTAITSIKADLAKASQELSILSETYGEQSPMIKSAKGKIKVLEKEYWEALENLINSQEQRITMLQKEEEILIKQYEEQQTTLLKISEEAFTLQRLKDTMTRHRSLYDALSARTAQIDVSTSLATTNVQIIEKAAIPTRFLPQRKRETILKYLIIGLILGGGLAFLLETLDKTIKTPEDLIGSIDIPLLGFIPAMDEPLQEDESPLGVKAKILHFVNILHRRVIPITGQRYKRQGKHISQHIWGLAHEMLLKLGALTGSEYIPTATHYRQSRKAERTTYVPSPILTDPQSSISEAYRHIRTNLLYSNVDKTRKVLTFTSCGPKEGKTTTSCNLALSIAMSRKKVLLIDADLHRPKIHKFLNIKKTKDTPGLTSVLVGETTWRNALQHVIYNEYIVGNLDVILSGPTSPHPAELLGSEAMQGILREAKKEYDWIIIDTPPILFVSDAVVMSSFSDGTVLVVKAGTITKGLLDRTKSQLDNIQSYIIGSILNNMILARMGRYYSYYGYHGYSNYSKDYHKTYYGEEE